MRLVVAEPIDVVENVPRLQSIPITCDSLKCLPRFEFMDTCQSDPHILNLLLFFCDKSKQLVKFLRYRWLRVAQAVFLIINPTRGEHDRYLWCLCLSLKVGLSIVGSKCHLCR